MKSLAATVGCVFGLALAVAAVNCAIAQNGPSIPAWVHPGVVVAYDGISSFVSAGRPTQPVQVVETTRVNSLSGGVVAGISQIQSVGTPVGQTHAWSCNAAGVCQTDATGFNGKFWVDPANPTGSMRGPNGEQFRVMGSSPYSYGGKTWAATTMAYQGNGVTFMCIFETKTGLIVAYSETYPTQQTHTYLRSTSGM